MTMPNLILISLCASLLATFSAPSSTYLYLLGSPNRAIGVYDALEKEAQNKEDESEEIEDEAEKSRRERYHSGGGVILV